MKRTNYLIALVISVLGFAFALNSCEQSNAEEASSKQDAKKTILFLAGNPSHSNGEHEFRAGCMLLADALNESGLNVEAKVHYYGWPKDESIFEGVDACIIYADAGGRFGKKYAVLDKHVKRGMGIMFMHYGVHPKKAVGENYFKHWIGAYMDDKLSVNPHWIADIKAIAKEEIAQGLEKPIKAYDEFYFNMKFPTDENAKLTRPLAVATPTPDRIVRYINMWNKHGEACFGKEQALMWCRDPETGQGGRGVGFVGGHYHRNWAIDDFRKLVLNAIVWTARMEVPEGGVPSKSITKEMLNENLDKPVKGKPIELPTEALITQKAQTQPWFDANGKRHNKGKPVQAKKNDLPRNLAAAQTLSAEGTRSAKLSADVKGLTVVTLRVNALGANTSDWVSWVDLAFQTKEGKSIPVTAKDIAQSSTGWGQVGINKNANGETIKIAGKEFAQGIGVHAPSAIILKVPKNAVKLIATGALDDGGAIRDGKPSAAKVAVSITNDNGKWAPEGAPRNVDLEYFVVPEGMEVTRWASSPLLFNPTNIDIDEKGRIWAAEGVNYRRHKGRRPGGDRIVVIEDSNGDGKADKSHTFVQEKALISPLGVAVFDNVVVVSQPPSLIVYTDVNRDLKFDPAVDKREEILTGFNAINHDHSLHSVTGGPDGKWYFNNGNCGAIFTSKDGKTFRMGGTYYKSGGGQWPVNHTKVSGMKSDDGYVWTSGFSARMNADGTGVEIIGHGYRNSYEHATTSFGDLFQNDNDDPPACRVSYVLPYGSAGYFTRDGKQGFWEVKRPGQEHWRAHWRQDDPGTFDAGDVYGGGSPTGIVYYENGALGDKYQGLLLSAEAGKNVIYGYLPKPKGATYQLDRMDFITTNPEKDFHGSDFVYRKPKPKQKNWKGKEAPTSFRPSDVAIGPDGAIYVSDWFDGRVGGHGDLDSTCSGAIYRIAPKGFKPSIPAVDFKTTAGQIEALKSPAINVRYSGFHGLKKQGAAALPAVNKLLNHPNPYIAARAIWLLPYLGEEGKAECIKLLKADDIKVRRTAYQALERAGVDILPFAKELAADKDPAMRRDVALSMRGKSADQAAPVLLEVAKGWDGKDKNYLESIGLGAENHESAIWTALKAELAKGQSPEQWSDKFAKITWRLWPAAAVSDLKTRALSSKLTAEQRAFAVESLGFIMDRSAADAILELCEKGSPVQDVATSWLFRNALGAWRDYKLMGELKKRGIYDPEKVTVSAITVAEPAKPSYSVEDVLKLKGNAEKGKATIMRCVMCHKVENVGPDYGPFLKGWGVTQPRDVLARSIVEPNADIAHGFTGYKVVLKDGNEVHGLVLGFKDPVIIKSTGGTTQLIPRNRIKEIKQLGRTLMLSADQLGLSAQDVADIVEYMKVWK